MKINEIFNSGVTISNDFSFPELQYDVFLTEVLTSHLQTEMTTVIESSDEESALNLFKFLSLFCLTNQLSLSSDKYKSYVVPGLYLQIVTHQDEFPLTTLYTFERPWTWIRLDEKLVVQITDYSL